MPWYAQSSQVADWLVYGVSVKYKELVFRPFELSSSRCTVIKNSPDQTWYRKYVEFHCDDCGSSTGFRSRSRTFSERWLLPIFLLRPVRCAECFRRDYRLLFMPVEQRLPEAIKKVPSPAPRADRNVA
jgi:hypothetical protein